jgi:hypothetical protein
MARAANLVNLPALLAGVLVRGPRVVADAFCAGVPGGPGVVAAATLAQICMLLALAGDRPALGLVLWPTVGLAAVLAVLVSGTILGEVDAGDFWRLIGVIAILDVLGTLVTIALAKFGVSRHPDAASVGHH